MAVTLPELCWHAGGGAVATARKVETLAEFAGHAQALVAPLDVTKADQIARVVEAAEARFGCIDVLVNNAGYGYLAAIEDTVRGMNSQNPLRWYTDKCRI